MIQSAPSVRSVGATLEALLRRALLAAARDFACLQDRVEAAELAAALGDAETARTLHLMVHLRRGFGAAERARHAAVGTATGLWADDAATDEAPVAPAFDAADATALAIAQVEWLAGQDRDEACAGGGAQDDALAPAAAVRALAAALAAPYDPGFASLVARLWRDFATPAPEPLAAQVGAPIPLLVEGFIRADLGHFLRANHDLAVAPWGTPRLLHASARLERAGAGAYLAGLASAMRSGRDVLGLARIAAGSDAGDAITRWTLRLASHLTGGLLESTIDELGDLALTTALAALLDRAARMAPYGLDRGLLWRVRDAAIDLGAWDLATRAQRVLAERAGNDLNEWRILGDLHAAAGAIGPFAILRGFGSSAAPRAVRAAHRGRG